MKLLDKDCGFCSKQFTIEPYMERRVNFCSRICANRAIAKRNIGKRLSIDTRKKIGLANSIPRVSIICVGCSNRFIIRSFEVVYRKYCTKKCYLTYRPIRKGYKLSTEHVAKLSGENANNWQGGKSTENEIMRKRKEYRIWREAVFKRDDFTCQRCGVRGGELNADHIKPFAWFPELRFAIDNGRTLCVPCHKETPTFGGKISRLKSHIAT